MTEDLKIKIAVDKLNRLFKLYVNAAEGKSYRPYRVLKLKEYLKHLLAVVQNNHDLIIINTSNFHEYFPGSEDQMNLIKENKIKALKESEYEVFLNLKETEKDRMKGHLIKLGIQANVYFFEYKNKIFKA